MAGQAKNRALNRLPGTVKLEQNEAKSPGRAVKGQNPHPNVAKPE